MGSNLHNQQLNIDCYMQKVLYTNLMVTTDQKPLKYAKTKEIDIQICN